MRITNNFISCITKDSLYALSDNCRTQMANMKRLCYIWSAVINYNLLWC